jgi:eukaryotic-like serine/threonine-protein kinase
MMKESEKEKYLRELKEFYKNKKGFAKKDKPEEISLNSESEGNDENSEEITNKIETNDISSDSEEIVEKASEEEVSKENENLSFWAKLIVYKNYGKVLIYFVASLWFLVWFTDNIIVEKIVHDNKILVLPNLEGLDSGDALGILRKLELRPRISKIQHNRKYSSGKVIRQLPVSGVRVRAGRPIYLTVSSGSETVKVPDLTRKPVRSARAELMNLGLSPGKIEYIHNETIAADMVISQSVTAGMRAHIGDEVSLRVSRGSENLITMPRIVGLSIDDIEEILSEFDLNIGSINYVEDETYQNGTIISQFPESGEQTLKNSFVDLDVVRNGDDDAFEEDES